jgi:hypothetical protein
MYRVLSEEIARLPLEKIGKAVSFVRYLSQESETELVLDPGEEAALRADLMSGDFVGASNVLAKIEELPDD